MFALLPAGLAPLGLQGVGVDQRVAFLKGLIADPGRKSNEKSAEEELAEAIRAQAGTAPEAKP